MSVALLLYLPVKKYDKEEAPLNDTWTDCEEISETVVAEDQTNHYILSSREFKDAILRQRIQHGSGFGYVGNGEPLWEFVQELKVRGSGSKTKACSMPANCGNSQPGDGLLITGTVEHSGRRGRKDTLFVQATLERVE